MPLTEEGLPGPMKAGWLVALVATAAASGCAGGEAGNPNLSAPKLVLQARPDGSVTVFMHGAFGDRLYDWISLAADNLTLNNRSVAFSLEETVNRTGFFLDATAGTPREMYTLRARVDVDLVEERVFVAFHEDDAEWSDRESFDLPFERLLVRRASP